MSLKLCPFESCTTPMRGDLTGWGTRRYRSVHDDLNRNLEDIERAEFPEGCLVIADEVSKTVWPEDRRIGFPTILRGCRKSHAFVGWCVSAGAESAEQYWHVSYSILPPNDKRLRRLGLDPADYPGIMIVVFDQVVVDRGPGAAEAKLDLAVDVLKVHMRLTRATGPQDKGGKERERGQAMQRLRPT